MLCSVVLPSWHFGCLRKLKGQSGMKICYDCCVCRSLYHSIRLWKYNWGTEHVEEFHPQCGEIEKDKIKVEMKYHLLDNIMEWHFDSPEKRGIYHVIFISKLGVQGASVYKPKGKYRVSLEGIYPAVVKFVSDKGWISQTRIMYPKIETGL